LEDAVNWLERKIKEESLKRPEQVQRYKETLDLLQDRIKDNQGVESIPLSREDSEMLARLAKAGEVDKSTLKDLGVSTEDLITYEHIMQEAFKAGMNAATISMVLKVAPELFRAISYLISQGEIDEEQFRRIGFAAIQGGAEGFLTGTLSAAIMSACKNCVYSGGPVCPVERHVPVPQGRFPERNLMMPDGSPTGLPLAFSSVLGYDEPRS